MRMKTFQVRFTDKNVGIEGVERFNASGYKLIHAERVLSFHDDHGNEVFATDIHNIAWWKPEDTAGQTPGQRTAAPVTSVPAFAGASVDSQGRSTIGDQVAAEMGHPAGVGN